MLQHTHTHTQKKLNIYIEWVERRRSNFCYRSCRLWKNKKTTSNKNSMSAMGKPRTFKKTTNQEILEENAETNTIINWGEPQTITILRSSNVRGRHPPCPSLNRPRYQTCEWTHCVWMSGLSAEEPGSSPPDETPPWLGTVPLLHHHHPSNPPVGGARSPAERVACAREWTDELCVLGCVRDWECAVLGENACRDWEVGKKGKKKDKNQHLKIEKRNKMLECCREEILPLKEADPQIFERRNFGYI